MAFAAIDTMGQDVYLLIEELESRFGELIAEYPGNTCGQILEHDPMKMPTEVCPPIIAGALQLALEILKEAGIGADEKPQKDSKAA